MSGATGERRRPRRRILAWVGAGLGLVAAVFVVLYWRQLSSIATHVVGPPEHTYPATVFPPGAAPVLRLAAVGDVGVAGEEVDETAAAMIGLAGADGYDALVLLGDNAYPDGDLTVLEQAVFAPFGPLLDGGAELLAVLGNHDVLAADGGAGQVARLGMPGRWWSQRMGDVEIIGLDSNRPDDPEQLQWLTDTLEAGSATWRIVVLHHGPYSAGYQGSTVAVREAFSPLFERYGVQLVISGHEHDYERSVPIGGVTYLVSGAGSEVRRTGTEEYTAYSAAAFHFLDIDVFADRIYVQAIGHDGRKFDDVTILP